MTCFPARSPSALAHLEATLTEAAAAWGRRLERSTDPVRRAADSLLLRLGFDPGLADRPGAAPLEAGVLDALSRENDRLRRLAERGDARYDLNRHIAVMRLLRGGEPALPAPAFRATGLSGAALNRRFRRTAGRD